MNARLALFFYNLFFPVALLVMLPGLIMRIVRRGNYRRKFGQRLGFYDAEVRRRLASGGRVWVHSISVGETFLALKLASKMKSLMPDIKMVLSVTTSTGFALADEHASDWLEVIYNPVDCLPFVHRAFRFVQPVKLIFIEAMWPNLLLGARRLGIPVAMIPRLSERSERRFRKFRYVTGGLFGALDCLCAQEPEDAARLESVGADPSKIEVTGSIKFDYADDSHISRVEDFRGLLRSLGVNDQSLILLAGSTFPGEEKLLAEIFCELRKRFPVLFLILVPRHVERIPEIVGEISPMGLRIAYRSKIRPGEPADCLIIDTTGELRDWYHLSTVSFIGKSLESYGGQNPVEAAITGQPVIFGPHMENFRSVAGLLVKHGAAIQVSDTLEPKVLSLSKGLKAEIADLLAHPEKRRAMNGRGLEAMAVHQGATERAARILLQLKRP